MKAGNHQVAAPKELIQLSRELIEVGGVEELHLNLENLSLLFHEKVMPTLTGRFENALDLETTSDECCMHPHLKGCVSVMVSPGSCVRISGMVAGIG